MVEPSLTLPGTPPPARRGRLASLVAQAAYPSVLILPLGAAHLLLARGVAVPPIVAGVGVVVALAVALLEWRLPHREAWRRSHGDVRTDVLHLVFAMLPIPVIFRALAMGGLVWCSVWLASRVGAPLWPSSWSLPAQLLLALVVAEFGQYWAHRLAHERRTLWRLHKVHHSVERLYWLNAGRFHPLDTLLQHASEMVPLVLLGANEHVLALFAVFTSANGLLRHANVALQLERPARWAPLHRRAAEQLF